MAMTGKKTICTVKDSHVVPQHGLSGCKGSPLLCLLGDGTMSTSSPARYAHPLFSSLFPYLQHHLNLLVPKGVANVLLYVSHGQEGFT